MYNLNFDIWKFGYPQCANSANGALSKVTIHKYEIPIQELKTATQLDLSGKDLNYLDAIIISALIKDNGAMSCLNILKNTIGDEQTQAFLKIKKDKGMSSICGIKQDQTKADLLVDRC